MAASSSSSSSSTTTDKPTTLNGHYVMVCHSQWRGIFFVEPTMTNRVFKQMIAKFVNEYGAAHPHMGIKRMIDEDSFELRQEKILDVPLKDSDLVEAWSFIIPSVVMVVRNKNGDLKPIKLAQYAPPLFMPSEEFKELEQICKAEVEQMHKGIVIE
ncbi:MAG: hypothetical protein ACOVQN_14055 [Exiguobacterium sp.]|jgi:hypothetical protein